MNTTALGLIGLGAMLALLAVRVPIAFGMAIVGFVGMIFSYVFQE